MKYPYLVVRGGIEYPVGTEVPETDTPVVETVAKEEKKASVETKTTTTRKKK